MPESENSTNNQLPPPSHPNPPVTTSSTASVSSDTRFAARTHVRDSDFYYRGGSAVFLVGNKLFKFPASLFAADDEYYEFKHLVKDAIVGFESDTDKPGTDDAHPIVLPTDVTEGQFRDFLMVVFGGVTNHAFLTFLRVLQTPPSYSPPLVSRLTNIGYLGCRFGMKRLNYWSQSQIHTILRHFVATNRLTDDWDAQVFLRLVQYLQNATATLYRAKLSPLICYIISALVKQVYDLNDEIPQGNIIDVCATLYQDKDVLINSPAIFGLIFAVIVSLGPQSPIWTDRLAREDRRVLYAANSTLTRLSSHTDLDIGWVVDPTAVKVVCSQCSSNFDAIWENTFSQCKSLKSRVPSKDIRHVVCLPVYRTRFLSIISTTPCLCLYRTYANLNQRIDSLYCGLTEKYKFLAETV